MDDNKTLVQTIIDRMKTVVGVAKDVDLAEHFGGSRSGPAVWKVRGSIPFPECMELAQQRGVSLDWLILGRGEQKAGTMPSDQRDKHLVELPGFDMATYAGAAQQAPAWWWAVPAAWLESEGLEADSTIVLRAAGDPMAPTIAHGQIVIVDRTPRDIDGVFLVRFADRLRFKRVQRAIDGGLRLSNDNPAYTDDVLAAGDDGRVEIIGQCHAILSIVR